MTIRTSNGRSITTGQRGNEAMPSVSNFLQYWLDHSDLVDVGGPASDPARKLFDAHEAATRDLKKAYSQTSALIRPIQKGKTWAIGFGSNVTDEELQALVAEMEKKEFLV